MSERVKLLRLIAEGLTAKEMAAVIGTTLFTAGKRRRALLKSFGAKNCCELLKLAYDGGLLKPGEHYRNGETIVIN